MSKRKSFGKFTAMSLAGISAMSTMAIVAEAATYSVYIYDFQYDGLDAFTMSGEAKARVGTYNTYVKGSTVSTQGMDAITFSAEGLAAFQFNAALGTDSQIKAAAELDIGTSISSADLTAGAGLDTQCGGGFVYCVGTGVNTEWIYKDKITGDAVKAEEYAESRDSAATGDLVFYFKSKTERDAAITQIKKAVKADYTAKYNAAATQFNNDLTTASNNIKTAEGKYYQFALDALLKNLKASYDSDVANAKATYTDPAAAATLKTELDNASKNYNTGCTAARDAYNKAIAKMNADYTARNEAIRVANAEFKAVYNPVNFNYDLPFVFDDSAPEVAISMVSGSVVGTASYKGAVTGHSIADLAASYYRSTGVYETSKRYAFKGEIAENLATIQKSGYVPSTSWKSLIDILNTGSSSGNFSEGTTTTDKTEEEDKKEDNKTTSTSTWYPTAEGYRISNSSNISYLGANKYWYTSASAAELYGGGYTGTTKTSNYTDVKGSEKIYFNAVNGLYSTKAEGSLSYLVETNEKKQTDDTPNYSDPYYYYYLMGLNGNGNTTTKVDPDAPTIYGSSKKSGWARIASIVKTSKSGATVTIDMNGATTIPEDVIKAAAGKDITLKVVNSNGSIVTINPDDVNYTTAINVGIKYNTNAVSKSLKNKAIKANKGAVSTTQITVGEDGDFGADITATVKLSAKRAGCTVKAYRLSSNGKKLTVEAKGTVKSNGTVNLKLDNGGVYLLVVID